ncbi:unnamed protein product [Chironomus riparius]|uniref:Protein-lysine N-methyltransferase CHIRRI_LOCUS12651 n=1 Tax=Chironomus riparius TaxID=315576 RepID=A0A9N9S3Y2_9DIPT|nr:unnamed protein product [Chironomus riparius]
MSLEDDDIPQLSADTQAILSQFLKERDDQEKVGEVSENWQLSQFWYDEETQKVFGKICKKLIREYDEDIKIALLSCPSLFETVRSIADNVKIFEYDERFKKYENDFVHYDYNLGDSEDYLKEFTGSFDVIILDPPFLSEECLTKSYKIVSRIKNENSLIILNTGSIQRDLAVKLGLKESNFKPRHKNNLANDFSCFANFDVDKYIL